MPKVAVDEAIIVCTPAGSYISDTIPATAKLLGAYRAVPCEKPPLTAHYLLSSTSRAFFAMASNENGF
jgi:hypothetical protein